MKKIITFSLFFIMIISIAEAQQNNFFSTLYVNPTPSPYLSDWQNNPSLGNFVLTYNGTTPISFIFNVKITSPQYGDLISARSPQTDWPAGPYTQIYSPYDIITWNDVRGLTFNNNMKERIIRSGRFPEGEFTLHIEVKSLSGEILNSNSANFTIIYPEPPQLILPQNGDNITSSFPVFQWSIVNTPPSIPVTYKIKIVEKLNNQTPVQAINANPIHHQDSLVGVGFYTYPTSAFPFENGKQYVWQITSTDANGDAITSNNGKSEIWTFTFGSSPSTATTIPDTVKLVQNVAYLINLRSISSTPYQSGLKQGFRFSGSPSLVLIINGVEKTFNVNVNNLIVLYEFIPPNNFNYSLESDVNFSLTPQLSIGDFFKATDFAYSAIDGASIGGSLNLPGVLNAIPLNGRLTLSQSGISGQLSIERQPNNPIYTIGQDLVRLLVTKAEVTFSQPTLKLSGILQLFGQNSNCNVENLTIQSNGTIEGAVSCSLNTPISLVPGSNRLNLTFKNITGNFSANALSNNFNFNLSANCGLDFRATDTTTYGADLTVTLSNSGFNLVSFTPRGEINPPPVDLGWIKLAMSNLSLAQLSYTAGNWNFALGMNVQIQFPTFNNFSLPQLTGVTLGPDGLTLPSMNFPNLNIPEINLQALRFNMRSVRMNGVTIPFFASGLSATQGLSFSFDFSLRMANLYGSIADQVFNITNASFSNGVFSAAIPPTSFNAPGINVSLTSNIIFYIRELAGSLSADFSSGTPALNPDIRIRGNLKLPDMGSFFNCPPGTQTVLNLMETSLNINGSGKLTGSIQNISIPCPIEINPLTVNLSNIAVNFSLAGGEQRINFQGNVAARINIPGGSGFIEGNGSINYELITNSIEDLNVSVNNQFNLGIPTNSPALSFQLPRARITREHIILDGRANLALSGGTNIGVTFRNLALRWSNWTIASGDVIFDTPFAFKVTLEDGNLRFNAVPPNSTLTEQTGIMLNLPNSFVLNSSGFSANGSSRVTVKYQGTSLDSLLANYSNDFSLSLSPFKVSNGQVEFMLQNRRVAYINQDGFFPDLSYFASQLLPERIPLPAENIAYLIIKQGNTFLIDYSNVQNGVRIQTRPGQPVKLVMPILKFSRPTNPELSVSFDVVINPQSLQFVSGSINVSIPNDQLPNWDLSSFGIPFKVSSILYGQLENGFGFSLGGNIKAFGNDLGTPVNLKIYADGNLTGDVDFTLNQDIQLIPNNNKLILRLTRVASSFNMQLNPLNLNFNLLLSGGIKLVLSPDKTYGANATFRVSRQGINIEDFVLDTPGELPNLDFSWFKMGLSNFSVPNLTYNAQSGWDFEIRISAVLDFPSLNFKLPQINNILIRKTGITIPQISIPSISDSFRTFFGFGIKPLAFRMQQFTFDWFNMQNNSLSNLGFQFDFELSFAQMPTSIPEQIRNIRVRINNAGFSGGRITGNITPIDFSGTGLQLPLGGTTNFFIKQVAGNLAQVNNNQAFNIQLSGDIQLPEFMRCEGSDGVTQLANSSLNIDSRGRLSGTISNFVPTCPINVGIGKLFISNSSLVFNLSGENQDVIINLTGNLKLPAPTPNDSITATGNLTFNLLTGNITDGEIAINTPFRFQIPNNNPLLVFTINSATLNNNGLRINGTSRLNLTPDGSQFVNVNFAEFLFDIKNLRIKSGVATLQSQFALKLLLENGSINWSVIPVDANVVEQNVIKLTLPQNIIIQREGIGASGESSINIRFNGNNFANLRAVFSNDFLISYTPVKVSSGEVRFFREETLIGVLNKNGFQPGDILGMLPIPEKLPLPDTTIAYLVLKNGDNVLVNTEVNQNQLRISTRAGQPIRLVMPGLRFGAPSPPEVSISFNIVVNVSTFEIVSGSINVTPPTGTDQLFSLENLGIPLKITRLLYERDGNNQPQFKISARVVLPPALNSAVIRADSLIVSSSGISGTITVGNYSAQYVANTSYITTVNIGNAAQFKISGLTATLSGNTKNISISGDVTADIFRDNNGNQSPIHWTAGYSNNRFNFSFDISHIPNARIPLLIAYFQPQAIGGNPAFNLDVSSNNFALTLSGVLSAPSLSNQFQVSFSGLRISNNGITIPDVSINVPNQQFNLFGATFALRDVSSNERAISFSYMNRILYLTLNGDLTFMGNTSQFRGLRIGSDGSLALSQANLISNQIWIVQNIIGINRLSISSNNLSVQGFFKLPKPADTSRQNFSLNINSQGQISGSSDIVVINENPGIGGGDQTEWNFWIAKYDITYARLRLNLGNNSQSYLEVNSDIYFMNNPNNYVRIGYKQGSNVFPGFRVSFNGNIQWGNLQLSNNLTNIDWEAMRLNFSNVAFRNNTGNELLIQLSGNIGINLAGVTGNLNFNNLRISSSGGIENLGQSIQGGTISVANIINVTVSNVSYQPGPTYKWIKEGTLPGQGSGSGSVDSVRVSITNYFSFSATISIPNVASGGIEEFVMYKMNGQNNMVIKNANLNIPNVVRFRVDFTYQRFGNSYYILVGGNGRLIDQYDVNVIGKVAQINGQSSFGIFVSASGLSIMLPPGIRLSSLGGGFFYNPSGSDLQLVRSMCGLDNQTIQRINTSPGRFAVLIYAEAALIDRALVGGRALLTITQNYFELNGQVVVLNLGNQFNGYLYLNIAFNAPRAMGTIRLDVTINPLATGNAQVSIYFFSNNIWGIDGSINLRILNYITSNSSIFIGNPGFYVSMSSSFSFDVWKFTVDAGMSIQIWRFRTAPASWGAYASATIDAKICGVNFASVGFNAGLINQGFSLIYGEAVFSCLAFDQRAWGAIYNGSTDGGLGGDSNRRSQINDQITRAQNMRNQKDQALQQINNLR